MQFSDWVTAGPGRDAIEATCRRWLAEDPTLPDVRVRLEGKMEQLGVVRR